jgi:hypothetical protein
VAFALTAIFLRMNKHRARLKIAPPIRSPRRSIEVSTSAETEGVVRLPWVSSKLEPGAVIVHKIERGALSPVTVMVVSPAFLVSPWARFANQLAMHQSIEAASDGSATLVPAILADCALPLLSRFRVPLDFRNQDREHCLPGGRVGAVRRGNCGVCRAFTPDALPVIHEP